MYIFNKTIHPKQFVVDVLSNFQNHGELLVKGRRNTIKIFPFEDKHVNVKQFKQPNFLNTFVYRYIRKSKAQRSFEYAEYLLEKGIRTPTPYAFAEDRSGVGLGISYYFCEHVQADLTYRELVEIPDFPDHEIILRKFSQFCIQLHDAGVEFKDHSPGNTLIKKTDNDYLFYLVDLNRMTFHKHMSFELRMKNMSRLTPKKEMVRVMANEYSKFYFEKSEEEIFNEMWKQTSEFQEKFFRKQRMKKKLKFWKK